MEAKLENDELLFADCFYGEVQARHTYGYLAPEWREDWSDEDLRHAQSLNPTGLDQNEVRCVPDIAEDLELLSSDSWNWTSQPGLTEVFEEAISRDQGQKAKPFKPFKQIRLRDVLPGKLENSLLAQKIRPPKPARPNGVLHTKLDADSPAQKRKPPNPA